MKADAKVVTRIRLRCEWQPERVYTITSEDVPGLIIEADTRADAFELAPYMATETLAMNGSPPTGDVTFEFTFIGETDHAR